MEEVKKSDTNKLVLVAVPLVIVVIIIAAIVFSHKGGIGSTVDTTASAPTPPNYKDGTYTAEGDYTVHIGQKHIDVKITLKNNIITAADVTNEADDPTSVNYQNKFISGYKDLVIGKNINDVHLGAVSGSSLTPMGFNAALSTIESQAKM